MAVTDNNCGIIPIPTIFVLRNRERSVLRSLMSSPITSDFLRHANTPIEIVETNETAIAKLFEPHFFRDNLFFPTNLNNLERRKLICP